MSDLKVDKAIFENGTLSSIGPLDQDQQSLLFQVASSFIRESTFESRQVGEKDVDASIEFARAPKIFEIAENAKVFTF